MSEQTNTELKEYLEQEGISHDDIINNEIEQEHSLTDEEKAKLAAEAEEVELAEGETIDEGISDEETLGKAIQASMKEKKELFLKEIKENPNKRLYSQKIIIEFAELIEVDKNSLRYEENEEDYKFNNDLMKSKSTDFSLEVLLRIIFRQLSKKLLKFCNSEHFLWLLRRLRKLRGLVFIERTTISSVRFIED